VSLPPGQLNSERSEGLKATPVKGVGNFTTQKKRDISALGKKQRNRKGRVRSQGGRTGEGEHKGSIQELKKGYLRNTLMESRKTQGGKTFRWTLVKKGRGRERNARVPVDCQSRFRKRK